MSLRISFELTESDLKHFRLIMNAARNVVSRVPPEDIVAAAEELLAKFDKSSVPQFVLERLQKLSLMIRMLSDIDWRLPHADAKRVLSALAYFTEPDDLIPDHIPGLGFLDDAIMIELLVRELRHEIEAYEDFCDFRSQHRAKHRHGKLRSRDLWLENRREELQQRMKRRRNKTGEGAKKPRPGLLG
ncbi:MAG TPA: YkvA family protein [Woeseiaceae bacterium]|nr:YkvA family protein [Woeseiaceae bacterium]